MHSLPGVTTHMGTSEDNSEQLLLSLYYVASRNGTRVFRLGGKGLGLMFRLSSPLKLILCHKLCQSNEGSRGCREADTFKNKALLNSDEVVIVNRFL